MSLGELLRTKSSEYELLAEWHAERAPLDDEHFVACQAMAVVGIVLREVAEALDVDWRRSPLTSFVRPPMPRTPQISESIRRGSPGLPR